MGPGAQSQSSFSRGLFAHPAVLINYSDVMDADAVDGSQPLVFRDLGLIVGVATVVSVSVPPPLVTFARQRILVPSDLDA